MHVASLAQMCKFVGALDQKKKFLVSGFVASVK